MTGRRDTSVEPRGKPATGVDDTKRAGGGAAGISRAESTAGRRRTSAARRKWRGQGAETRQRLVEAALDIFGRLGFDGATTRQIANQAGTNLAAIKYHFGSKEALHVAVAEHIVAQISSRVGPVLVAAQSSETPATPQAAHAGLIGLIDVFIDTILGEKEAEQWARFIVREQMQPTQAFEVIYRFIGSAHELGTRLLATAMGKNADDEEARLRAFALIGQVLVFRVAQALVLRRMDWRTVGEAEREKIKRVVVAHIDAVLNAEAGAA